MTPTGQRLGEHENIRYARPLAFAVNPPRVLSRFRDGHPDILDQLHGLLIQANHRQGRIAGFFIAFEHFFHAGHELRVALGRDDPVFDLAAAQAFF